MDSIYDNLDLPLLKMLIRSKMNRIKCEEMVDEDDDKKPVREN